MKFNDFFKLKDVTMNITNSCNLNCIYCFEHNKNGQKMSLELAEKIIDKCYANYVANNDTKFPFVVNFFGGEPFLAWDVIEHSLKYAKNKKYRIDFGVTTNLTMLTDHMIDIIEEYDLGLLVSVDGIKEIHDKNRCNSYDIVMKNLKRLLDRDLKHLIEVRMTVMPSDLDNLLDGIQTLFNLGIDNIAPVPVTDTNWTENDLESLKNNMRKVWTWAFDVYNDEENKRNLSLKCIDDYLEMMLCPNIILPSQTNVCTAGTFSSCSIGVKGDIMPCHQRHTIAENYDDLVLGNINNDDDLKMVQFNNQTINSIDNNCEQCLARAVCKGGCPSENLTKNKNGNIMNKIQCSVLCSMVEVAQEFQYLLLTEDVKNIRSHKLNVLSQNIKLFYTLLDIIQSSKSIQENELDLVNFYGLLTDMEDILLPSFRETIFLLINGMVNIIDEQIKNEE